jgi:uncharacterized membrane protein YjfL (UPF0719 family)
MSDQIEWGLILKHVIELFIFVAIGVVFFALAVWAISRVVPFSLRKEIEEDQNISLGIIIGAVIIGIALIVSAAMRS